MSSLRFVRPALALGLALGCVLAWPNACSVYDTSLLEEGGGGEGGGGTGTGATGTGGTGTGGVVACQSPDQCPGQDTECATRTCDAGICGTANAAKGKVLAQQTAGDCQTAQCDGNGAVEAASDDTDVEDDGKECTDDACANGLPTHDAKPEGSPCGAGNVCTASSQCVECIVDGDCASNVCDTATHQCASVSCGDTVKNGTETDVDCGGNDCPGCGAGDSCLQNTDCVGGLCTGQTCAPTCTDGAKNAGETDVDCGGPTCPDCAIGQSCSGPGDCQSGNCSGGSCQCGGTHLVIGEVKSRGTGGGNDEFIEIHNPTNAAVTLDATWKLQARSSSAASFGDRWTGSGAVLPAHGHYLITGAAYAGAVAGDAALSSGVTDASAIRLQHNALTVDEVCYFFSAATLATLTGDATYECEGTPVDNSPHDNNGGNIDQSLERKPGGALGNCTDTADSSADFSVLAPSTPQNLASPPTP